MRPDVTPKFMAPWLKIKAKVEAGESVPPAVRRMAEAVIGHPFVRPPRVKRPDFRDREAGDDSFDSEGVPL